MDFAVQHNRRVNRVVEFDIVMSGNVITFIELQRNPAAAYWDGYAAGLRGRGLNPAGGAAPGAVSGASDSPPAPGTELGVPRELAARETLRVVVPGGAVTSAQLHAVAHLARCRGHGEGDVTASGGIDLPGFAPRDRARTIAALSEAGLAAGVADGPALSAGARPRRGHVGVARQTGQGRADVGVAVPVGRLTAHQMDGLALVAALHGSGELRLTARQNVVLLGIPRDRLAAVEGRVRAMGLDLRPTSAAAGLSARVTASGSAAAAIRAHGLTICHHLDRAIALDMPVAIEMSDDSSGGARRANVDILLRPVLGDSGAAAGYDVALAAGPGAGAGAGAAGAAGSRPARGARPPAARLCPAPGAGRAVRRLRPPPRRWRAAGDPGGGGVTGVTNPRDNLRKPTADSLVVAQ